MTTDNQNGVALVERGYNEPTRCLNFRVGFPTYGDGRDCAIKAVEAIGQYNSFDPARVVPVLIGMVELSRGYGEIMVGRQSSPVIYVRCTETEATAIMAEFHDASADECDYCDGYVRAWWD